MRKRVEVYPIELNKDGDPLDPALYAFYVAFCEKEFKAVPDSRKTVKTWGAFVPRDGGGYEACAGILSLQWQMTCPTFHIGRPVEREDIPIVQASRDGLLNRAKDFLHDNGAAGIPIHVYVSPESQDLWKPFLESLGARGANLFTLEV